MKKILWVTLEFPPDRGGIATYLKHLMRELGGNIVSVLAQPVPRDNNQFDDTHEPYRIIRRKLLFPKIIWPRWIRALWHVLRLRKKTGATMLATSHVLPFGYVLWLLFKFKKIPYWINVHGMDLLTAQKSRRKTRWLKKILRYADRVVVNSVFTKQTVMRLETVSEDRITLVYPCPDTTLIIDKKQREDFRARYALSGKQVVLSLGRLVERKGFDQVIRVFTAITQKIPRAVYLIAGDGPEASKLERLVVELKLQNNVRLLGPVSDEDRAFLYASADVFVMPTRAYEHDVEGFGIVYLEAAAYGLPVIATSAGGAGEAVMHGVTGLLINSSDPAALEAALLGMLQNESFRKQLGDAGRDRVRSEFIWADQAAKLKPFLD